MAGSELPISRSLLAQCSVPSGGDPRHVRKACPKVRRLSRGSLQRSALVGARFAPNGIGIRDGELRLAVILRQTSVCSTHRRDGLVVREDDSRLTGRGRQPILVKSRQVREDHSLWVHQMARQWRRHLRPCSRRGSIGSEFRFENYGISSCMSRSGRYCMPPWR